MSKTLVLAFTLMCPVAAFAQPAHPTQGQQKPVLDSNHFCYLADRAYSEGAKIKTEAGETLVCAGKTSGFHTPDTLVWEVEPTDKRMLTYPQH